VLPLAAFFPHLFHLRLVQNSLFLLPPPLMTIFLFPAVLLIPCHPHPLFFSFSHPVTPLPHVELSLQPSATPFFILAPPPPHVSPPHLMLVRPLTNFLKFFFCFPGLCVPLPAGPPVGLFLCLFHSCFGDDPWFLCAS